MRRFAGQLLMIMGCAVLLWGCGLDKRQKNIYDLYELRPAGVPTDNDSYYVPPRRVQTLCSTIGVNPSCSGM